MLHLTEAVVGYGYLAIFLIMVVEEAGVPMPIPGDALLLFAGYLVSVGTLSLGWTLLVVDAGALLGASILYFVAHHGGRALLLRYGRFFGIDERRLDNLSRFYKRLGPFAPGVFRLIPGIRIYSTVLAGIALVPYKRFMVNVAWACTVWALAFLLLGELIGQQWRHYFHYMHRAATYSLYFLLLCLLVLVVHWSLRHGWLGRRRSSLKVGGHGLRRSRQ